MPKAVVATPPSRFGLPTPISRHEAASSKTAAKPPPTLPKPVLLNRYGRIAAEIPVEAEGEKLADVRSLDPIPPRSANGSLATSSHTDDEDHYEEVLTSSDDFQAPHQAPRGLSDPPPMKERPVPLPSAILRPDHDPVSSDSISVSLDSMLPASCTFLESDNLIQGYRRRDARTMTFPRTKPVMPTMSTHEINILERYAKT